MAPLVRLSRARWWAPEYRHLARRVRVRPLRIIRSAGAQNPWWREMLSVLFKEPEDRRQARPHRAQFVTSLNGLTDTRTWVYAVHRHFNWMAQHGVDGAFLQRFAGQCDRRLENDGILKIRDEVGDRVREAAEKNGRAFAIM